MESTCCRSKGYPRALERAKTILVAELEASAKVRGLELGLRGAARRVAAGLAEVVARVVADPVPLVLVAGVPLAPVSLLPPLEPEQPPAPPVLEPGLFLAVALVLVQVPVWLAGPAGLALELVLGPELAAAVELAGSVADLVSLEESSC